MAVSAGLHGGPGGGSLPSQAPFSRGLGRAGGAGRLRAARTRKSRSDGREGCGRRGSQPAPLGLRGGGGGRGGPRRLPRRRPRAAAGGPPPAPPARLPARPRLRGRPRRVRWQEDRAGRVPGTGDRALLVLPGELLPECCRRGRPRVQTCPVPGEPRGAALGKSLQLSPARFLRQDFKSNKTRKPSDFLIFCSCPWDVIARPAG